MLELAASNKVWLSGGPCTWRDLVSSPDGERWRREWRSLKGPVAAVVDRHEDAYLVTATFFAEGVDGLLLTRERLTGPVRELLERAGYLVFDCADGSLSEPVKARNRVGGRVSLLTSGTMGVPKLVEHRWETLFTAKRNVEMPPRVWLVPYQVGTYAWYQLVTLGMFKFSQDLVPVSGRDVFADFERAAAAGCDSISATPTYWRVALLNIPHEHLQSLKLKTITLGGERVDQLLLDKLCELFPRAQVTHIYATSEAGVSIVVKDRLSGFPVTMLAKTSGDGPQLRVHEGRLQVKSSFTTAAASGESERWIDTGDLVEVRGDRVVFVGRADSRFINVGGAKVIPADVENALLQHPAVAWCRVLGVKAPWVGELAMARVVLRPSFAETSETELAAHCARLLPEFAVPRLWQFEQTIPMHPSLKSPEQEGPREA